MTLNAPVDRVVTISCWIALRILIPASNPCATMSTQVWPVVTSTVDAPDPRYCEPFEEIVRAGLLPRFIEIFIERDLELKLSRI